MNGRIERTFARLKAEKRKALIVFITAGDPGIRQTERLVQEIEKAGADLIELGVPFSDPLADGPVIQASSERSLKRGTHMKDILALVKRVRGKCQCPILLMGYLNPMLRFGMDKFIRSAKASGVDGLIVPDLPPDEGREIERGARKAGLDLVYLLAPTSTPERIRKVCKASRGFVYYVSMTGVTGGKQGGARPLGEHLSRVRRASRIPVCVGFGVSTPKQAKEKAAVSDGVIIGSAIVRQLAAHPGMKPAVFAKRFVRPFAAALTRSG